MEYHKLVKKEKHQYMDELLYKTNKRLSQCGLVCILLAYLTALIYGVFIILGMDYGYFVVVDTYLSRAGVILSLISLVSILISRKCFHGLIYIIPALILATPFIYSDYQCNKIAKHRIEMSKEYSGEYNLRLLGKELIEYANAHNSCLPPADQWCDCLMEFNKELTKENFRHPQAPEKSMCNYVFNSNLGSQNIQGISDKTIFLFESDGQWNLNGTTELLKPRFEKDSWILMLYYDGTVREYWFSEGKIRDYESQFGRVKMVHEFPRWKP